MARHGGGAFSGKDPTKVDRSAAYAARWVAKNVVAAGLADRFEVEVAYGIGIARPISFSVDSFGTGRIDDAAIQALIERHFDLRPASIIAALDLRRPIYRQTASYGHFGRPDLDLPVGANRQGRRCSPPTRGCPEPEPLRRRLTDRRRRAQAADRLAGRFRSRPRLGAHVRRDPRRRWRDSPPSPEPTRAPEALPAAARREIPAAGHGRAASRA